MLQGLAKAGIDGEGREKAKVCVCAPGWEQTEISLSNLPICFSFKCILRTEDIVWLGVRYE